ncbi:MAG: AAA family ATPase [Bacteroidetes bacterium]|nr:AAA family ATPase [Bacteroidota bacterium]
MTKKHNKLVVFCGPSGAGKSTLAKIVMKHFGVFELSISATTRQPRQGEEHGVHYWYISTKEFKKRIANNEFLEIYQ